MMNLFSNKILKGINEQFDEDEFKSIEDVCVNIYLENAVFIMCFILDEDKDYLLEHGSLSVHHSLGRWIRNNWGLWNEEDNELKTNLKKLGYIHPDDMSNYIIEQYIEHLKLNYENK